MFNIYSINNIGGIITIRFSCESGMDDIKSAIDAVAESSRMNELRLWDLSCAALNPDNTQLRQLADYARSRFLLPSKVAIVASEDLVYGLSRMYEIYREEGLVKHMVFRSEREARTWLSRHEIKTCPRCLQNFECKYSDIQHCQCKTVVMDKRYYQFIHKEYDDCLCASCLEKLCREHDAKELPSRS